jgi:hypothetical protein
VWLSGLVAEQNSLRSFLKMWTLRLQSDLQSQMFIVDMAASNDALTVEHHYSVLDLLVPDFSICCQTLGAQNSTQLFRAARTYSVSVRFSIGEWDSDIFSQGSQRNLVCFRVLPLPSQLIFQP